MPPLSPACHQLLANSSNCDCMFFFRLFLFLTIHSLSTHTTTHTHTHIVQHTTAWTLVLTFGWRQLIFVTFSFIFISCCCRSCCCCSCCCSCCCCCCVFVDILFFSNLVRLLSGTEADVACCYLDNCWKIFASPFATCPAATRAAISLLPCLVRFCCTSCCCSCRFS